MLDDARPGGAAARLFRAPVETIEVRDHAEVAAALDRVEQARGEGRHAAGFLSYEAGLALENRLAPLRRPLEQGAPPLLWFGLFEEMERIPADEVLGLLPDPAGGYAAAPVPRISQRAYESAFAKAQDFITAGDIYQTNLTFGCDVPVAGDPLAIYARLRAGSLAGYGGALWTGAHWLLSLSPELFFSLKHGTITARPMKGTAVRHADPEADRLASEELQSDPKQRAENLMICDLLRNDLSRVAADGSVQVPSLFHVESYPTVHQMTSTVTARLAEGMGAADILRAIYPCGSITGAPKIRAMEIIHALETDPRGPYTGSIGWLGPDGDAAFNVAIRTLVLEDGATMATLGLGSGIVADSRAGEEWRECLAKGAFVTEGQAEFDLIETMRFDPVDGVWELERHLERAKAAAVDLGFAFDRHAARNELQAATFRLTDAAKIRLLVSRRGRLAIEIRKLGEASEEAVPVAIVKRDAPASDFRLRYKTSARSIYEDALAEGGTWDVLLEDGEGYLSEGCFTNIFVERDGALLTPPLSRGLLDGILRQTLIAESKAVERDLTRADLEDGFFLGNAVRGMIPARLA
ncbi:aminodeoxychorismate synthase component I [Parasphingopyxis sp. GrpM-11]|uniref:Probable branched-chain-amino-acid aminotransferase n=1 Tax=Parasphingopyxis marina TaxID=2761622 RepID=A0A842I0N4_9SPHN|nr:aminodeoxychorismate synthase component I [Parasphingopyxis marina]